MKVAFTSLIAAALFLAPQGSAQTLEPGRPDSPAAVRVVFYNLKNYLAMDRRVAGEYRKGAPKPAEEIEPLIEGLAAVRPDILGVCEIGTSDHLEDLRSRLHAAGVPLPHTELVRARSGFDRNLALLSRFPIVETDSSDTYTYRLDGQVHPFQRGVLDATIQVTPDYRLRCVVLHLKSKREVPGADEARMRLSEAELARTHLDGIFRHAPETNLLVIGDLNDHRHEAPVKALQGYFGGRGYLSPLPLSDRYGFRWTHHWVYADSYSRFDYALVSRGITGEIDRDRSFIHHWEDWDDASDHRPLVVTVIPVDRELPGD